VGCDRPSELKKDTPGVMILVPGEAGIESAEPANWQVGPDFRQRVHKGVRVALRFPVIRDADLRHIVEKTHADAWLIRVTKRTMDSRRSLGLLGFALFAPIRDPGDMKDLASTPPPATFNIVHADAAPSVRFERFNCPAFGTQKTLK